MATISIPCKKCGNTLWEIWDNKAECTNCLTIRPFYSRISNGTQTTPSQLKAIDQIKSYFENHRSCKGGELHEFTITKQEETGFRYVSVKTTNSPFTQYGGFFMIGRKGGIEIMSVYDLCEDRKKEARWYAKMIGTRVSKHI